MEHYKKPPRGLMPERIWKLHRFEDVTAAIQRYLDAGLVVKDEWLDEYKRLKNELHLDRKSRHLHPYLLSEIDEV